MIWAWRQSTPPAGTTSLPTSYSTFCYCVLEVACLIENRASIIMSHTTLWFDPNGRKWVLEVYYQSYQLSILWGQLIMFKNKSSWVWCIAFAWKFVWFGIWLKKIEWINRVGNTAWYPTSLKDQNLYRKICSGCWQNF